MPLTLRNLTPLIPRRPAIGAAALSALAAALALSGCHSHQPPESYSGASSVGERQVVAMQGSSPYFDGQLLATVTISRAGGRGSVSGKRGGSGGDAAPDISGMSEDDAMAYLRARAELGSPMPAVALHLKLENKGKDIVQVDVLEFSSDLGNFAVDPELLSLAPGQIAEPYPMISQLGVTSDVIPVKVTLRMGGKAESETIQVKNLTNSSDAP